MAQDELKMDQRSKCKLKSIQPLEDNIRENLDDKGYGDGFSDTLPKAQAMKRIINELNFSRL